MTESAEPVLPPVLPAAIVCAVLAVVYAGGLSLERSWGWDESMHAELPAARIVLALRAGELGEAAEVVHGCQQYPFVWPAALAAAQAIGGVSEGLARGLGRVLWFVGCFGLFLLGRELVRILGQRAPPAASVLPWLAMALGLACPLALAYSGTLFQEVPFTVAAIFTLLAWLRRDGRLGRELVCGGWIALAFFTRFNAGLCLGLGLALDLAWEGVAAARAGEVRDLARRTAALALVPALAFAWWFLLPLPGGGGLAADHRDAFWTFLGGNRGEEFATPWRHRLAHWTCSFSRTPRVFLLQLAGVVAAVPLARGAQGRGVRALLLVLVGGGLPVWTHEFHLDRFLIPGGPALWALGAVGLTRLLPRRGAGTAAAAALGLALLWPALDARPVALALIGPPEEAEEYVAGHVADWGRLDPGRPYETNGLARAQAERLLDLVAAEAGSDERVAWLGINSELSPAAIHLGLLARGGSPERFRRDAARTRADGQPAMCVTFEGADPGWSADAVRAWAAEFDVVFTTRPVDFKGRSVRDFVLGYQAALLDDDAGEGGAVPWTASSLGTFEVARPLSPPVLVEVFACRRTP